MFLELFLSLGDRSRVSSGVISVTYVFVLSCATGITRMKRTLRLVRSDAHIPETFDSILREKTLLSCPPVCITSLWKPNVSTTIFPSWTIKNLQTKIKHVSIKQASNFFFSKRFMILITSKNKNASAFDWKTTNSIVWLWLINSSSNNEQFSTIETRNFQRRNVVVVSKTMAIPSGISHGPYY